jgi:hypothetical protein
MKVANKNAGELVVPMPKPFSPPLEIFLRALRAKL